MKALITGIAGQDGSYLADLLLEKGYQVHGIELPVPPGEEAQRLRNIAQVQGQVELHYGSVGDRDFLREVVSRIQPDECYHLAAISHVSFAFEDEAAVLENNVRSTHALLGALKENAPESRFFFAGSSEMFGTVLKSPQDEGAGFHPRSMYGISKLTGHHLVDYYRNQHDYFACTGILYNHESPRRGPYFVTRKITSTAARIKAGLEESLSLGNLDARRDWGYAPDYVHGMWLMLQQDVPEDFVLATGETHTVREFVDTAFQGLGLDYRDYVKVDPRFYREAEQVPLCGNPSRAHDVLQWRRSKSFREIVTEMVENDIRLISPESE